MLNLNNWFENYKKYIKFQTECLLHAYEYGGIKFSKYQFPSFQEFESKLNTDFDYLKPFMAMDYNRNFKPATHHNVLNQPFRTDLHWCRVSYSLFYGVKHNKKFYFTINKPDLSQVDRNKFIKNYK